MVYALWLPLTAAFLGSAVRRSTTASTSLQAGAAAETKSFVDATGAAVTADALANKRVALYFAAGWCPMCTSFEPSLQQFRQAAADSRKPVELVYVPSDRNADAHAQRVAQLGMWTIPYDKADQYKKDFNIWSGSEAMKLGTGRRSGVPALVVLDTEGKELAFLPAESQGSKALEKWPLDEAAGLWGTD